MIQFDKHKISIRYWMLGRSYYRAIDAMEFASKYHTGLRKDKITPEFHHQISIAHYIRTLPNINNLEDILCTVFLHDTVEDYNISLSDIELKFGATIREAVEKLSKQVSGQKKSSEEYFSRLSENPIASIVKGGDRIHNLSTLTGAFTLKKQQDYIKETEEFILPMLKRARRNYSYQELAYENIKHVLINQVQLIKKIIESSNHEQ